MNFTFVGLSLGFLLLLPAAEASCIEEFPDPTGDTNPPGVPGYYDLTGVRLEIANGSLNWSWQAVSISESINALYMGGFVVAPIDPATGQPQTGTGAPFFHPSCSRSLGNEGIQSTRCDLSKNDSLREGPPVVTFEFVAFLNWSQKDDSLTVEIPGDLIGLNASTGLEWIYGSAAIAAGYDFEVAGLHYGQQTSPVYPDDTDSFVWPACHVAEAESMPGEPVSPKEGEGRDAPGPSLMSLVLVLAAVVLVRRQS